MNEPKTNHGKTPLRNLIPPLWFIACAFIPITLALPIGMSQYGKAFIISVMITIGFLFLAVIAFFIAADAGWDGYFSSRTRREAGIVGLQTPGSSQWAKLKLQFIIWGSMTIVCATVMILGLAFGFLPWGKLLD